MNAVKENVFSSEAKEGERMRDLKPNKTMTEIEYIEWIIDLFFANKRAYKRRTDNDITRSD